MTCQEFEKQWAELDDSLSLTAALDAHRQGCHSCREVVEDVGFIREQARALASAPAEDPPERVWRNVRVRLMEEGLIAEPRRGLRAALLPQPGWFVRFSTGLAYASVFGLAVGVMYLHSLLQGPTAPPLLSATPQAPAMALEKAPLPEQDIQELEQHVPPEQRAVFVTNWQQVNSSIQQLTDSQQTNPDDPFIDRQLMDALQQRQHLWETFVRWEDF